MKNIIIDWLQFTLKKNKDPRAIMKLLNIKEDNFQELEKGGLGYKRQKIFNNIKIFYEGQDGMGSHCQISGKGCRYLESRNINLWQLLFKLDEDENINITRLDIALDTDKALINKLVNNISKGNYISKSRSIKVISKAVKGKLSNETIYIGSRSSEIMIRIYDKAVEQNIKDKTWERWEIELKKKRIKNIIPYLKKDINKTVIDTFYTYFRPVVKKEQNSSRSKIEPYFKEFIKDAETISLYSKPESKSIEDKYNWLNNQIGPTLSLVSMAFGNSEWLKAMARENVKRLKSKDYEILKEFLNNECGNN